MYYMLVTSITTLPLQAASNGRNYMHYMAHYMLSKMLMTNHKLEPLPPVLLSELDSPPCCFNCHCASGCCQCSSCWATRIIAIVGPGPAGGPACRAPSCSWGTSSLSESLRSRAASSSLSQAGPSESESPRAVVRVRVPSSWAAR